MSIFSAFCVYICVSNLFSLISNAVKKNHATLKTKQKEIMQHKKWKGNKVHKSCNFNIAVLLEPLLLENLCCLNIIFFNFKIIYYYHYFSILLLKEFSPPFLFYCPLSVGNINVRWISWYLFWNMCMTNRGIKVCY